MFANVTRLLQEVRDNFLERKELLNRAQGNFAVTKDVDTVVQFWKCKTIIAGLKKN